MSYIAKERRSRMLKGGYLSQADMMPGDLNFVVSTLMDRYLMLHGVTYENINALIGVLEWAKLELYRRIATPYIERKMHENGDVYLAGKADGRDGPI